MTRSSDPPSKTPRDKLGAAARRVHCFVVGHRKQWDPKIMPPIWTCDRCGFTGGLAEHSQVSLLQFLGYLLPAIVLFLIAWLLISIVGH